MGDHALFSGIAGAQADLSRDGYAMVRDVFSADEVTEVEDMLDALLQRLRRPDCHAGERRFARDMAAEPGRDGAWRQPEMEYAGCLAPALLETALFRRCRTLATALGGDVSRCFDHAIYKPPGQDNPTPWHQDAAFSRVPQGLRPSRLHVWIPLRDASEENGCMHYIPGSHRRPLLRHERFRRSAGEVGLQLRRLDTAGAVACPVPRGGLVLHTPHTLHCAGPNLTGTTRKAWIIQFARFGEARLALKRLTGRAPR